METKTKLVFFDLDGTLVGKSGTISHDDLQAVYRLKALGIKIAIASGRSVTGVHSINQLIGFTATSSLAAGAVIFNPQNSSVIALAGFKLHKAKRIWEILQSEFFYTEVYTLNDTLITAEHRFAIIHSEYMDVPPTVVTEQHIFERNEFSKNRIIKLEVVVDNQGDLARLHSLMEQVPDIKLSVASGAKHPSIFFINITDAGADRSKTFAQILQIEQIIPAEVLSFGDSESDRIFIESAGIGVAMANAPTAVKRVANLVTDSVEMSGVSKALKQLIFDRQ